MERGFTLIEIMIALAISGVIAFAIGGSLVASHSDESKAYSLIRKSDKLLSVSKGYYQSACKEFGFELTLARLKQKNLIDNSFALPNHQLTLTAARTPAAKIHLQITLSRSLATAFLKANPKAKAIDYDTVRITLPVSTQLMLERERLMSMKTLWGEDSC